MSIVKCLVITLIPVEELETHPVGKNPLGFRNPLGYNGFNGGAYPTFDKDHDEKGRPTYYKK